MRRHLPLLLLACSDYELGPPDPYTLPGTDTSASPSSEIEFPEDFDDCEDGYYADYYNLPRDHADVETSVTGVTTGDVPWAHD